MTRAKSWCSSTLAALESSKTPRPEDSLVTPIRTITPESSDYAEIARRPLDPEQCALIGIDIQEKLLPPIFEKERLLRNSQLLIRMAGVLKMPTLLSTQYSKGLGSTVPEVASLLPDTSPIEKQVFSCFGSDVFCATLERLPGTRNTVVLCGMESHIFVAQTALAALREGYVVHV